MNGDGCQKNLNGNKKNIYKMITKKIRLPIIVRVRKKYTYNVGNYLDDIWLFMSYLDR